MGGDNFVVVLTTPRLPELERFIASVPVTLTYANDKFEHIFNCRAGITTIKQNHRIGNQVLGECSLAFSYSRQNNIDVETRDRDNPRLTAFRRNLYFPQMLFNLGLTGHREERLLLKIESQDQGIGYQLSVANVNRMGFFFAIQVPPLDVLCAMKFTAVLARQKGRDFYDTIFLLSKTRPNLAFLRDKLGIASLEDLKAAVANRIQQVDLNLKKKDFNHLLFKESNADRILQFTEVVQSL